MVHVRDVADCQYTFSLATQILENVVLGEAQRAGPKDRKVVVVGLSNLLTITDALLGPTTTSAWYVFAVSLKCAHHSFAIAYLRPQVLEAALDIFTKPQELRSQGENHLDELDPEDSSFQASFSKLGASETFTRDPVATVTDPKAYLSKGLAKMGAQKPGVVSPSHV